jgi:hypothetical protein
VVTKVFEVEFAPVPQSHPVDDDLGFQDEINQEQTRVFIVTDQGIYSNRPGYISYRNVGHSVKTFPRFITGIFYVEHREPIGD